MWKEESWLELPLEAWRDTGATLHMWTQIVGKVRLSLTPWISVRHGDRHLHCSRGRRVFRDLHGPAEALTNLSCAHERRKRSRRRTRVATFQ